MTGTSKQELYMQGLRNAHALETEALQIMQRQVDRLEHYPEMKAGLQRHIQETEGQRQRVEQILSRHDSSPSTLKEAVTGLAGNVAALAHTVTTDEVLKDSFVNFAFEHLEQAAYMSLITMAEAVGDQQAIPLLRQNLEQEVAFGKVCGDLIAPVTQKYMERSASGQPAKV